MPRRSLLAAVSGITFGVCGVAHANLITIDANDFAPGTDLSSASSGVSMSAMSYAFSHTDASGNAVYAPILTGPIYSRALTQTLCSFQDPYHPPCLASGNEVFGYLPGTDPAS